MFKRLNIIIAVSSILLFSCSSETNNSEQYIKSVHQRIFDIVQYHDRTLNYLSDDHDEFIEQVLTSLSTKTSALLSSKTSLDTLLDSLEISNEFNLINIINRDGLIICSNDSLLVGVNEFDKSIDHKRFIKGQFESKKLLLGKYEEKALEVLKTSYITSVDSGVVIQLISTSHDLSKESEFVQSKLNEILKKEREIKSIKLFQFFEDGKDKSASIKLPNTHLDVCDEVFLYRKSILRGSKITEGYTDTEEVIEQAGDSTLHYVYSYVPRTDLLNEQNTILQLVWVENK